MTVVEDRTTKHKNYEINENFDPRGPGARAAIARALISSGITLWHGLPERILDELHAANYKVKKKKKKKKAAKALQ